VTTLVFRTGQAARTDYIDVSGVIGDVATRDWGLRSSVGVPIRVEDRLWGAAMVALTRDELLPADAEARLAGFTELVGTAIASAQARAELQGFGEEQAALRRVATLAARAAPPEEVLAAVTEEAGRLLDAAATILCRYDPDSTVTVVGVLLEVRDDGAGGAGFSRGTGLAGLKDRVEALGGRIFLDSPRGAGTRLRVELPLTAANGRVITS
jgi:GAF domain-containing protein